MVYIRNFNYILRKVHDTYFFIDITDNYINNKCTLIETNEIGEFIWEHIEEEKTLERIVELLKTKIVEDIPYNVILKDIKEYLETLESKGVVCRRT